MNHRPNLIQGGIYTDHRGHISYVNDFKFDDVCRFYVIEHPNTDIVRAWQGHRVERKYFYVVRGVFVVAWVEIDNWGSPSRNLMAEHTILTESDSKILCIPCGYANGLKALKNNSKIIVFSDMEVEQSVEEKIRFDANLWFDWKNITKASC